MIELMTGPGVLPLRTTLAWEAIPAGARPFLAAAVAVGILVAVVRSRRVRRAATRTLRPGRRAERERSVG